MKSEDCLEYERAKERLTWQVLGATTLPEVLEATQALEAWIKKYPQDEGMSDAFEQLSMMEDIARDQLAELASREEAKQREAATRQESKQPAAASR